MLRSGAHPGEGERLVSKWPLSDTEDTAESCGAPGSSNETVGAPGFDRDNSTPLNTVAAGTYRSLVPFRKALETVKGAVDLPAYAGELTALRRSGTTLVGRCPLPGHEDRT